MDQLCEHIRSALGRIEKDGLTRPVANDEISSEVLGLDERRGAHRVQLVHR